MKSINMSEFGYSMMPGRAKLTISKMTAAKKNGQEKRQGLGIAISRTGKKPDVDNKRLSAILIKFNAGKKLTNDELAYLRQKQPETYMKVKQVLMEREMLEQRMKAAKTKEQTAAAYMSSVSMVPTGRGNGNSGGGDGMAAARINQMAEAHRIYTASREYKAKEDNASLAEKEQIKQEEIKVSFKEQKAKLEESIEKQKMMMEKLSESQEEQVSEEKESKMEKVRDAMEDAQRLRRESRRKRKKVTAQRNTKASGSATVMGLPGNSYEQLRDKLRELYRERESRKDPANRKGIKAGTETEESLADSQPENAFRSSSGASSVDALPAAAKIGSTIDISL